jgi:hypothetical protein
MFIASLSLIGFIHISQLGNCPIFNHFNLLLTSLTQVESIVSQGAASGLVINFMCHHSQPAYTNYTTIKTEANVDKIIFIFEFILFYIIM